MTRQKMEYSFGNVKKERYLTNLISGFSANDNTLRQLAIATNSNMKIQQIRLEFQM